jgi:hypothetical protein
MFTPSFTPREEHSLKFRRMKGRNRGSSLLGDSFTPLWGYISTLRVK